jgi:hypothetical protein
MEGRGRPLMSAGDQLCRLRKRLASTEVVQTILAIGEDASELALTAPENLLAGISEFVDRVHAKLDHLAPAAPKAVVSEKRMAAACRAVDRVGQQSPAIAMRSTAWTIDEHGNRSRLLWNSADGASPPSPSPPP